MTIEEIKKTREVLQKQIDIYGQEYDAEGIEALNKAINVLKTHERLTEIIPEGATNGDMMKAVLPIDWESKFFGTCDRGIQIRENTVFVHLKNDVGAVYFTKEWWNSPYKAESEE